MVIFAMAEFASIGQLVKYRFRRVVGHIPYAPKYHLLVRWFAIQFRPAIQVNRGWAVTRVVTVC